ncbi:hypothetical protein OGZ37_09555 [Lactococcus lactis]|uniref:hypothetical protein n=1 Tax=Lactococcus lactis TaxID=1358 RepID=UPI002418989C|nr:hypothetical protein [Lactococcus lactis]MDG4966816.1 hypothetical protein [Lactococcus lactis]
MLEKIVIKKNIFITFVQITLFLPMVFLIPFLILLIPQFPFILFAPLPICVGLSFIGYIGINDLIRFKNKKVVIDRTGISIFNLTSKTIYWDEINDIKLEHIGDNYFLHIKKSNSKIIDVLISDTQLKYSVKEIYSLTLEYWVTYNNQDCI